MAATPLSVLAEQFLVADVRAAEPAARYNVAPTDEVLAVATTPSGRRLGSLSWGLVLTTDPNEVVRSLHDRMR